MRELFQFGRRGVFTFVVIFAMLTATEGWFSAGPWQEQSQEKKSEPAGPKQTESDTVIGPKKQAPPKKKRISP